MSALLTLHAVTRSYAAGETAVAALSDVSLDISAGEFVALVGPSGCGKSTLLHLCGAMDRPTAGTVALEGRVLAGLNDDQLTLVRRARVGFVFQFFNLLPTLTVIENVQLPLLLAGSRRAGAESAARTLLDRVGLARRLFHYPRQLSGGEMQRVAVARALVHRPALVIADEPTGNLDSENGHRILDLLTELNVESGVTLMLATHAPDIAAAARRVIRMRDGRIEDGGPRGAVL
ncbi:MAG: ABC transporter ATP-binding protein [Vicinamibacterales bacterium]